jgi:hypothetical protein
LLNIYLQNQSTINLYAFIGGVASAVYPEQLNNEKDYTVPLLSKFKYIEQAFTDYHQEQVLEPQPEKPLVLQISGIPCANRPYLTAQLLNKYSSKYTSRHILGSQYSKTHNDIPYREFPVDLLLKQDYDEIIKLIKQASIIHIHHRADKAILSHIPSSCKVVYTVSNINSSKIVKDIPENTILESLIRKISHIITVTDQPIQKQVYSYLTSRTVPLVPCLMDKVTRNNKKPLIIFAPTNQKSDVLVSKGYYRVLGVVYKLLLSGYIFDFDLIEGIPYQENIHRKQMADIVIDDIINEEFHNSSIEGGILKSAVLTNYSDSKYPFIKTTIDTLEGNLIRLITDKVYLRHEQEKMKVWAETIYNPEIICKEYENLYADVLLVNNPIGYTDIVPVIQTTAQVQPTMELQEILTTIHTTLKKYAYINDTCLELIKNKTLSENSRTIHIALESEADKQRLYDVFKNKLIDHDFDVEINSSLASRNKIVSLDNYKTDIRVPVPVVGYLDSTFGTNWRN